MGYAFNIQITKEIQEITDYEEVNQKLKNGWVVLNMYKPTPNHDLVFCLGRLIA